MGHLTQCNFMVDAVSSGHKISLFFHVCSECIPTGTTSSRKEAGYWLRKLESFTRHSWMLLSFGEKTFHHTHCACHKTNCQLFHNVVSLFRSCYSSSQTSTYCIECVHTQLLYPTQHTKYYPLPSDLETSNSFFLGRSWQKLCMYYPRR